MTTLLSYSDAAERARVSEHTIRRRVKDGSLKEYRDGIRPRVHVSDVDQLFGLTSPAATPVGPCRVIAVANQKGGVGKTSTCANLSTAISKQGHKVLAIDCDPQGNLTQALGPDPDSLEVTLYKVLIDQVPLSRAILNPILNQPGLSLVGSNLDLAAVDRELADKVARELTLREAIEPYLASFEYIFIDAPPSLGLLTLNVLSAATEVIVPVEMGIFSLRGVDKLLDTIKEVRRINKGLTRIRPLCNRLENTNLSNEIREELAGSFGSEMYRTTIRKSVRVAEAQAAHLPITVYRPADPASKDYMALAEEVASGA